MAESNVVTQLQIAASVLPPADDLRQFARGASSMEGFAPVLMPSAYMRAQKRLPALRDFALAGAAFVDAFEAMNAAVREESDPDSDRAAQAEVAAVWRKMGGSHG